MKKILVTGGSGMVGRHLQKLIPNAIFLSSKDCDLEKYDQTLELFEKIKPNIVIHLASKTGSITDNINNPVDFFEKNILINLNTLKASHKVGVEKFIGILSTCIYPDILNEDQYPMKENLLHSGPPTKTSFAYAYSKRCLAVQIDAYNNQFGTKYSYLIPCNLYSEYDNMHGDKPHFLSHLIKKIHEAKINNRNFIELYGSGKPLRQFMYSNDLAESIIKVLDKKENFIYNVCTPENISVSDIACIALKACNAEHLTIKWDKDKPDGQFRKEACCEAFLSEFSNFKFTSLFEGIKKTYEKLYERMEA